MTEAARRLSLTRPARPAAAAGTLGAPLEALRALASRSRIAPRMDLDRACSLLRTDPGPAAEAFALAFLRGVAAATGRAVVLHRPGAESLSFDEAWMLRLIGSIRTGDTDSALFCLCSRIPQPRRAAIRFLAWGLAERLDGIATPRAA